MGKNHVICYMLFLIIVRNILFVNALKWNLKRIQRKEKDNCRSATTKFKAFESTESSFLDKS